MLRRAQILNAEPAPLAADPLELSRSILGSALGLEPGGDGGLIERRAGQLHAVDPAAIEGDEARIAFWTNLYNALILHRFRTRPLKGSLLLHLGLFERVAYRVGEQPFPLNVIENGILRRNRRAPLHVRRYLREGDPRLQAMPSRLDPRIHFALNCGAVSCPPIAPQHARSLDAELEAATRSYLAAETVLDRERPVVRLPNLMKLYSGDFGDRSEQLAFAAARLPELDELLRDSRPPPKIEYARFDWTIAGPNDAGGLG